MTTKEPMREEMPPPSHEAEDYRLLLACALSQWDCTCAEEGFEFFEPDHELREWCLWCEAFELCYDVKPARQEKS